MSKSFIDSINAVSVDVEEGIHKNFDIIRSDDIIIDKTYSITNSKFQNTKFGDKYVLILEDQWMYYLPEPYQKNIKKSKNIENLRGSSFQITKIIDNIPSLKITKNN